MQSNKLRELINSKQSSLGTRMCVCDPMLVEAVGHTGIFDYVEFEAEYSPYTLYSLENFCRAAELHGMSSMIKVDQSPRSFLAQRGIGAGFQSVLFADCRTVADVQECVHVVRPDTPEDGGSYGVGMRRFAGMQHTGGSPEYVQALRDIVVAIMIEKKSAVEQLDEILSVPGVDMIQWGPSDYSMSVGKAGRRQDPEIKDTQRKVIQAALQKGIVPRAEIGGPGEAEYFLDLGVRHFSLGTDSKILYTWLKTNGDDLRKLLT